jgi:hypothetical protein
MRELRLGQTRNFVHGRMYWGAYEHKKGTFLIRAQAPGDLGWDCLRERHFAALDLLPLANRIFTSCFLAFLLFHLGLLNSKLGSLVCVGIQSSRQRAPSWRQLVLLA